MATGTRTSPFYSYQGQERNKFKLNTRPNIAIFHTAIMRAATSKFTSILGYKLAAAL